MCKNPAEGKNDRGKRRILSGKCLMAVLMVAVMAVSCFVLINDSNDSSADNAQRVYLCRPDTSDDLTVKGYLEDGDTDMWHDDDFSASYSGGVLHLNDSASPSDYSFYDVDKSYKTTGVGYTALYADGNLVLEISGSTPELRFCTYSNDTSNARYGIYVTGNLTIINTGNVDRILKTSNHSSTGITAHSEVGSTGIYCGGSLTIQNNGTGSFTIDAHASDKQTDTIGSCSSYGLRAGSNITITNTVVDVSGGKAINTSAGIYCGGSLSVTNTKYDSLSLTATGSDCMNANATAFNSYGIWAGLNVSFTDVSVTATGGQACSKSAGIHSGGTVSATNSRVASMTLEAIGSKNIYTDTLNRSGYSSYGIDAAYINFKDVGVTATAADITCGPACSDGGLIKSIGINCSATANVNIISGKTTVTVTGGSINASTYRNGVYPVETAGMHVGKLNINLDTGAYEVMSNGGDVYYPNGAPQNTSHGGISYGIFANNITNITGRVTANGGVVYLPVGCTNVESYGIYSSGNFTGNGCTVTATASDASKISCGIMANDFDTGAGSEITCNASFVPGQNGKSIGLSIRDYTGRAGSSVECRSGVVCYPTTTTAGVWATNITLNGDAVLEGYGGDARLAYTSEIDYDAMVISVTSGSASDSYGIRMFGNITVNGTSRLTGVGGGIFTQAAHPNNHCTYGIYMNPATGDYSISGTGTVVATGGDTKYGHGSTNMDSSMGLFCGGDLTIAQATVTVTGGKVCTHVNSYSNQQSYNGSSSIGMGVDSLSLSDSANVTLCGGDNIAFGTSGVQSNMPYFNDSYGAYINGALSVDASTLNAIAGKASRMAGLYMMGEITVTGSSNVDATADSTKNEGYVRDDSNGFGRLASGIIMGSSDDSADITVTGSTLRITGSTPIEAKSEASSNTISSMYIVAISGSSASLYETSKTFGSLSSSSCKRILATSQKYTVSFDGNGGEGSMGDVEALGSMTLPDCGFARPYGKSFAGWAIGDPSGTLIPSGRSAVIQSDITIYAMWNDIPTYDVSFVKDDGITIYIKIGEAERRELTEDEISAGKVTGILRGTTVIFTAQPIDGYDLYYQVTSDDGTLNPLGMCMMTVTEDSSVAFTKVQQKYTITWKSQDGKTILETDNEVLYGTTLSYDGAAPTKANTPQYTYAFVGWATDPYMTSGTLEGSLPTAYCSITYYVAFSETVNTYTITWKSQDGNSILETDEEVPYGTQPDFNSEEPTKANTPQYTYAFVGWATEANQTTGLPEGSLNTVTGDVIYYVAFSETVNTYTVTWYSQDGAELEVDTEVPYGDSVSFDGSEPTKTNTAQYTYAFVGWATEANKTAGTSVGSLPAVSGDVAYYAAFSETVNKYTATFNLNGGSVASTPSGWTGSDGIYTKDFNYGTTKADVIADFGAYTWVGHTKGAETSTADTMGASGMTITAQWTINKHNVFLALNGGALAHTPTGWMFHEALYYKSFEYGTPYSAIIASIVYDSQSIAPSKTGYTFTEWDPSTGSLGDAEATLTAAYSINSYAVVLDLVGGTFANAPTGWVDLGTAYSKNFEYNTPYSTIIASIVYDSSPIAPSKTGYNFTGWSPNSGTLGAANATLTAVYSAKQYTASFDLKGGSPTSAPVGWDEAEGVYTKDFDYGTTADDIIADFGAYTRTGYTKGAETTSAATMGVSGMTITAQWTEWSLTVTFNGNGSTSGSMSVQVIKYSDEVKTLTPNAFVKTRHHFTQWNTEAGGSGSHCEDGHDATSMVYAVGLTITFYAQWEEDPQYTVTFNSNGGSAVDPQLVYKGEHAARPATPEKDDYVFAGWYTDNSTFENAYNFESATVTGNIILYAKWDTHQHTLQHHAAVTPTCTEPGNIEYWQCTQCGDYFSDSEGTHKIVSIEDPASGHEWGEWEVTTEPTCTACGTETRYCTRDHSHSESRNMAMINHNLVEVSEQEATCTEPGHIHHWRCTVCNNLFSDSAGTIGITAESAVIDALGHDLTHHDAQAPTCTEHGWGAYDDCSRCEYTTYQEISALGHDIVHHDMVPADCTHSGMEAYDTCSRCDYMTPHSAIPELGHNYVPTVTAPTCTEQGYTTHTCSRCHDSYVDSQTEALGHSWGATYEWSADGSACIIHLRCTRDQSHVHDITDAHVESSIKTAASTSSMGVTLYTVSATYDGHDYSNSIELIDIPALEPMPAHKEGTSTYENDISENVPTAVTETFNTAKTNGGDVEITVSTENAGSMTISFDNAAVNSIAGNDVTLEATVKKNSAEVADAELVIEVSLKGATFADGKAKVSVPFSQDVPEGKTLKVYFINGNERQDMNATLVDGKVVFETNHFSTYAVVFEDAPSSSSNGGGFPIWIIFVIIAVVAAAGAGAFFVIKQKKA